MYRQITDVEGYHSERIISDQKMIDLLLNIYSVEHHQGVKVEIATNADYDNNFNWDRLTVHMELPSTGYIKTHEFIRLDEFRDYTGGTAED